LRVPGGSNDFFGFGSGSRGIPAIVPRDARLFQGKFSPRQLQTYGQAFSNTWEPTVVDSARPALDWSAVGCGLQRRAGRAEAVGRPGGPFLPFDEIIYKEPRGCLFLQASQNVDHFGAAMPHFAAMNLSRTRQNRITEAG